MSFLLLLTGYLRLHSHQTNWILSAIYLQLGDMKERVWWRSPLLSHLIHYGRNSLYCVFIGTQRPLYYEPVYTYSFLQCSTRLAKLLPVTPGSVLNVTNYRESTEYLEPRLHHADLLSKAEIILQKFSRTFSSIFQCTQQLLQ